MQRTFYINGKAVPVEKLTFQGDTLSLNLDGKTYTFTYLPQETGGFMLKEQDNHFSGFSASVDNAGLAHVFIDGKGAWVNLPKGRKRAANTATGNHVVSPMPAKVIAVQVKPGEKVKKGAVLVMLEAMKLQHSLVAPRDGVVETIHCETGMQVKEGVILVELEE